MCKRVSVMIVQLLTCRVCLFCQFFTQKHSRWNVPINKMMINLFFISNLFFFSLKLFLCTQFALCSLFCPLYFSKQSLSHHICIYVGSPHYYYLLHIVNIYIYIALTAFTNARSRHNFVNYCLPLYIVYYYENH